jgi:hypothetical protein
MRLVRPGVLAAAVLSATLLVACGSTDSPSKTSTSVSAAVQTATSGGAASSTATAQTSVVDLQRLSDCLDQTSNSVVGELVSDVGEFEDLDTVAPNELIHQALGGGGQWLDIHREENMDSHEFDGRVMSVDVLNFASDADADAAHKQLGGSRVLRQGQHGKMSVVDGATAFIYDGGVVTSGIAAHQEVLLAVQSCLKKMGSAVSLPLPGPPISQ